MQIFNQTERINVVFTSDLPQTINLPKLIILRQGQSLTVPQTVPACEGYTFAGWQTLTGRPVMPGESLRPQRNVILQARWNKLEALRRTVTFVPNLAASVASIPVPITVSYGQRATVPNIAPSSHGSRFTGWNTTPDGRGETYLPGQRTAMVTENLTLYAQWLNVLPIS